jgi:hypothetical protein
VGPRSAARLVSTACVSLFLLLTVLVQARVLKGVDFDVAVWVHGIDSPIMNAASTVTATLFAFEASLVYATIAALVLWRVGVGRWSLAPFAFVILTAVETLLKLTLDQPGVPWELQRTAPYPFNVVNLPGSFPSGHAIRCTFFCVFVATLVFRPGQRTSYAVAA